MDLRKIIHPQPPARVTTIFSRLPSEIISHVSSLLRNKDIKALRLVCSEASKTFILRFNRIFLSPNVRDIEVFRAVADHPIRHQVIELIYDDARFRNLDELGQQLQRRMGEYEDETSDISETDLDDLDEYHGYDTTLSEKDIEQSPPAVRWFRRELKINTRILKSRIFPDKDSLPRHIARSLQKAAEPRWQVAWNFYQSVFREQQETISINADIDALLYGLPRPSSLTRITLTPSTHGYLYTPLYHSPAIRALPYGMNYPIPRGWPCGEWEPIDSTPPWPDISDESLSAQRMRSKWRGITILLAALAALPRCPATEFVVDVHALYTGLNPHMFGQPSAEYENFVRILSTPGFGRLELPIMTGGLERGRWEPLVNGNFRRLLATATNMEHFRLRSDTRGANLLDDPAFFPPPLHTMLPLADWHCLRHFGLSQFPVHADDLVDTLNVLPKTLRSIELSFLKFYSERDTYRTLFDKMKARLAWRSWVAWQRPSITIGVLELGTEPSGRAIWLRKEMDEFMYGDRENPMQVTQNSIPLGMGIFKDEYDEELERPYVSIDRLQALGIAPKIR